MKELKVKVWNYKNVLLIETIEKDESLKGLFYVARNGIHLEADVFTKVSTIEYDTTKNAKKHVKMFKQAVAEYNESINEQHKQVEIIKLIAEYYKVIYIKKIKFGLNKYFIQVKIKNNDFGHIEDNIDLPLFLKDSAFVGMHEEREYTLKELGLE